MVLEKAKTGKLENAVVPNAKAKFPDIPLPTFDGKYDKWLEFKTMFRSLVDQSGTSPAIKLFYLKKSLVGDAKEFLEAERISDECFEVAWEHLEKRFVNKRMIIENHISDLFNLKPMKHNNSNELRHLIDGCNKHIRGVKALGQEMGGLSERFIIHIVSSKLDKDTRKDWESQ